MQLVVDTTLVSALSSTGAPRRDQSRAEIAALRQARRAKELVVLALEVGGRFSPETLRGWSFFLAASASRASAWPCPPTRPQVSMGRRPWSVMCLLTAGSCLSGAAASGKGCSPAREELASVKTAAATSRARRPPWKPLRRRKKPRGPAEVLSQKPLL